ncbi:hypothetical protein JK386_02615 [Nocardioides sp. zg-536]|uniref:Uncharacterized protein n=1 Tax=Nocardioides faecalis TaxID=2803858 RepID=A0A938Y7R5_9ACTN|nr:hypothetical protein [Nocardioides faecalis]MBM9458779.1 hypothetical protein [Nocardioides faecalis]QVI60197.1 hypothetical protein KG111_07875 [Nocardioides faecalis]
MASAKSVVRVLDHGTEVETGVRRPIRLTPDGYAGVAYAGSVYPLQSDDVIDLAGPSWELADCDRFLFAGADVPYAPSADEPLDAVGFDVEWHLETNRYGHYVVFNASERTASRVVTALEAADLSVQRWDVSHRPAEDGNFYDWFARLRFKGSRAEALTLIGAVITPPSVPAPTVPAIDPTAARLADAEARIEELLNELYIATRKGEAAERELSLLRRDPANARANEQRYRESLALAERRHADLQEQLVSIRQGLGGMADAAELVKSLADAEELRELALAENSLLLERVRAADANASENAARADDLAGQVDALLGRLAELDALETERLRAATAQRPRRGGVVEFLPQAFGRLVFVLDSVDVIANLESPAATMRALMDIDSGRLVGKDLEGMRGWYAVTKLATGIAGSEGLGRIYYKPDGHRVLVNVHIKQDEKQQRRHIERLRSY